MEARMRKLIDAMGLKESGTSEAEIERFLQRLGMKLPDDYLELLRECNGAEGFVSENAYLSLYKIEDVLGARKAYLDVGASSWLVIFGTDGAGTAYCFDARSEPMQVLEASFPCLDADPMYVRGKTFSEFLEYLASQ